MKKWIIVGICYILAVSGLITWLSATPPALAQPSSGQQYYTYHSLNTADASAGVVVWSTQTNERFAIHSVTINGPVGLSVQLLDGATEIQTYYYKADGGACPIYDLQSAAQGNDLSIKASGAGQISICVVGDSLWY